MYGPQPVRQHYTESLNNKYRVRAHGIKYDHIANRARLAHAHTIVVHFPHLCFHRFTHKCAVGFNE